MDKTKLFAFLAAIAFLTPVGVGEICAGEGAGGLGVAENPWYVAVNSHYVNGYEGDGDHSNGFGLAGKLGYDFNPYVGAELESGWILFEKESEAGLTTGNLNVIPLLGNLSLRYPIENFVPYVVGGLGVYFFHIDDEIEGTSATLDVDLVAFGGKAGGGFDYYFSESMALNFETGFNFIADPEATVSAGGTSISGPAEVDNWYIGGGLKFRF